MTDKIDVKYLKTIREKSTAEISGSYEPGTLLGHPKTITRRCLFWGAWLSFWGLVSMWSFSVVRYLIPRVSYEPSNIFKAGKPEDYALGSVTLIETRKVWIIREERGIYALIAVCTHLSCQPRWLEKEQIFKCPCHGGQFYKNGVNFAGPPPKPLVRAFVEVSDDGRLLVDKDRVVDIDYILPVETG
ncbi:MAG: Rieske 2Fe-2S domain-containing protein [Candidatus Scalindua sp.]|jgi:cytochrome b6-f complex iron-sulfur subunit|nr:Rieske 2Fe-2S domain-containing protein [Candidatus Scalindua sp.]MDV5165440.1 Rieske 2Fe-2S domain-containing protein [Candidatus Scalindua sp.]